MVADNQEPKQIILSDPRKWAINLSLGAISTILLTLWGGLQLSKDWHFDTFVAQAQAETNVRELRDEIHEVKEIAQNNAKALDNHVDEFRVANAIAMYDRADEKLERYMRDTGMTLDHVTHDEHFDDLERRKDQAEAYLNCLLEKQNNCERLRPRL